MAVEPYHVIVVCPTCLGTKVITETPSGQVIPCTDCNQLGYSFKGEVDGAEQVAALSTKLDTIEGKIDTLTEMLKTAQEYLEKILSIVGKT